MPTLFVFLFKVNMALLVFCAGYYLVLRHLTFYTLNRVYLVTAIVFATIYPKIDLTAFAERHEAINVPVQTVILNWQAPVAKLDRPDYWQWVTVLFWAGAALLGARLLVQLFSLLKLHRNSTSASVLNHDVRLISGEVAPFSFWRSIYVNPANHTASDLKAILLHEQVHVNGWHTVDILLAELSSIFYWFNPGVWLMKKAVRENIEFITDRKILNKGIDTKAYQYSLVNVSFNATTPGIVNHFNISTIKKRIIMMNAKRSSRLNLTRYAFVLPAVALLLVFSISKAAVVKKTGAKAIKELTNTVAENLNTVLPESLSIPTSADEKPASAAKAEDTAGPYIFYINGIKVSPEGAHFGTDTESLYMLTPADAKKYFRLGDGKHTVALATTRNSAEGMALKNKLLQLIADKKIVANQLNPGVVDKLNYRLTLLQSEVDEKSDTAKSVKLQVTVDTNYKSKVVITTNNANLDSLNYVLNGKKISADEFKKIDPNKIVSVNIVSSAVAKTMLNDYDSMGFKADSKILFIATSDSEKGKELSDKLSNRITTVRINDNVLRLTDTFQRVGAQAITVRGYGKLKGTVDQLRINGKNVDGLSARQLDSIIVLRGGDPKRLTRAGDDITGVKNMQAHTTFVYRTPEDIVTKDMARVSFIRRPEFKSADVTEVRTMKGNVFYADKSVSRISDKLIIIDGKEASEKDLKKLSAFDIDRMSTASDADTVKKYGEKAKYGVVYIYTKKAK
ncbi:M56 family metallopeptidase [Mucilaginibacter pedocola]|uniref:Peptidase M56 domain-containing protein n=1 Tax=Mucilaginibacter pedocola TaxID=1792845 RepID=A0A1S9PKV3_9SPHI|nr:M56 family metallopeptidase [Mucilaginibacter pedocola]OOQ61577.1 hypothetical protein BC343_00420 [Mucilaginibacter pedocola]